MVALAFSLWGGAQLVAMASGHSSPNAVKRGAAKVAAPTSSVHGGAKATYMQSDITSIAVPDSTSTPVGIPINVKCPGTTGKCALEMQQDLQYCDATSGTIYYVEVTVDGNFLAQSPFSGEFGTEFCNTTSWTYQVKGLLHGSHVVQFYAFTSGGAATIIDYNFVIRVFKP